MSMILTECPVWLEKLEKLVNLENRTVSVKRLEKLEKYIVLENESESERLDFFFRNK